MNLSNVVIVLDHPDESRNIGAACRAMANNGISLLRIVGKKEAYDIEHIHTLAIHAKDIFDHAQFFSSITEATKDCSMSAGTTRRRGKKRGILLLPEEFAIQADSITQSSGKVAIVFGTTKYFSSEPSKFLTFSDSFVKSLNSSNSTFVSNV